ncbi:MAG: mycothiol synthase [Actinobacteria bacterium]|nr:mycothiol synthase [Actinomycetota bacterium]
MRARRVMLPDDRAAVMGVLARAEERDGFPALSEEAGVGLAAGSGDAGWVAGPAGRIGGFAHRRLHRGSVVVEMVVAGAGAGRAARRLIEAIREEASGSTVRVWASDPVTTAALRGAGARVGRRLVRLQRPLPADQAEPPEEVRITPFRFPVDEGAYLVVANDAFAGHPESSGWTRATFAERAARPWFDRDGLFLAWHRGTPVGASWTKVHPGGVGEIYSIAVRPSAAGRGLGRALVLTGFEYLAERRGSTIGMLWADRANRAAVRLYERLGMQEVRERTEMLLET